MSDDGDYSSSGSGSDGDVCEACGRHGELLLCDGCPRGYHLACVRLDSVPAGDWHCAACVETTGGSASVAKAGQNTQGTLLESAEADAVALSVAPSDAGGGGSDGGDESQVSRYDTSTDSCHAYVEYVTLLSFFEQFHRHLDWKDLSPHGSSGGSSRFSFALLEAALLDRTHDAPNVFLVGVLSVLLRPLVANKKTSARNWHTHVNLAARKYAVESDTLEYPLSLHYHALRLGQRIELLSTLCYLNLEKNRALRKRLRDVPSAEMRVAPYGRDKDGWRYHVVGFGAEWYVYRFRGAARHERVAASLAEIKALCDTWAASRSPLLKAMALKIQRDVVVTADLQQRQVERAAARAKREARALGIDNLQWGTGPSDDTRRRRSTTTARYNFDGYLDGISSDDEPREKRRSTRAKRTSSVYDGAEWADSSDVSSSDVDFSPEDETMAQKRQRESRQLMSSRNGRRGGRRGGELFEGSLESIERQRRSKQQRTDSGEQEAEGEAEAEEDGEEGDASNVSEAATSLPFTLESTPSRAASGSSTAANVSVDMEIEEIFSFDDVVPAAAHRAQADVATPTRAVVSKRAIIRDTPESDAENIGANTQLTAGNELMV